MIHYWLDELVPFAGRVAGGRAPAWGSPLPVDTALLRAAGVEKVYSLIEDGDFGLDVGEIRDALAARGIAMEHYPMVDMEPPEPEQARAVLAAIRADLEAGRSLYVHCVGGLGRTGTVLACLLVEEGYAPARAIAELRRLKRGSVLTAAQERFVHRWPQR